MQMTKDLYGYNIDGVKSEDYCQYCITNGEFTSPNTSMEAMVEICTPYMTEDGGLSEEEVREYLQKVLPTLKRWKNS